MIKFHQPTESNLSPPPPGQHRTFASSEVPDGLISTQASGKLLIASFSDEQAAKDHKRAIFPGLAITILSIPSTTGKFIGIQLPIG